MKFLNLEIKQDSKVIKTFLVTFFATFFLTSIFSPIGNWITQGVINIFVSISQGFSNFYYSYISLNDPNVIDTHIIFILWIIVTPLLVGGFVYLSGILSSLKNKINQLKDRVNKKDQSVEEITVEALEESISDFETLLSKTSLKLFITKAITIIVFLLVYFSYFFLNNIKFENLNFQNSITIISPYITEQKVLELKSNWALMSTKQEFISINNEISEIKTTILLKAIEAHKANKLKDKDNK
ncbi:MAG: hypothetical protein JZU47_08110 [Prolixibacteraceae bacterium]|nr:hypothetical protein [Prolixibacteraceae bacterium]